MALTSGAEEDDDSSMKETHSSSGGHQGDISAGTEKIRITVPLLTTRRASIEASRRKLMLKSPVGAEPMYYSWPLKKGKGSVKRSEDKQDEAAEIVETIRWVCEENEQIKEAMGTDYIINYDIKSYEIMTAICEKYNKAVDKFLKSDQFQDRKSNNKFSRTTRPHLKHILQKCYNKSVVDPNELNHYEAFTPEVYGETSFELICQILDKLPPITSEQKFVDLGSGVGQVVLQVAALTNCSISLGIEKASIPANYAKNLEQFFRFWMAFYGKIYSPFKLVHGDFLDVKHRSEILESTIVFVNNFAFGPEVDQHLKDIFADLNDNARIFSSKSFCALNFRITDRNLSDIGTIMHVSKMDPLKGSVSWTGKPVSYYLHIIDRAKLERYFQRNAAARKGEGEGENGRRGRRGRRGDREGNTTNSSNISSVVSSNDNSLMENGNFGGGGTESSCESRDISRASSIDKDENSTPSGTVSSNRRNYAASETDGDVDDSSNSSTKRKLSKRAGNIATNRKLTASVRKLNETDDDEKLTPPLAQDTASDTDVSSARPVRTVVANAAAITEAQSGFKKRKGRPKKGATDPVDFEKNDKVADGIVGLDSLHEVTLSQINASQNDDSIPHGCVKERLNEFAPKTCLDHVELAESLKSDGQGGHIPVQLQKYLDTIKNQMLAMTNQMQDPVFRQKVEDEMKEEKARNVELVKREKQLKSQIDNLIADSLGLLNSRLGELGINARNSPEFIEKAKGIVCSHHDLQRKKQGLEGEIKQLEVESEKMMKSKEAELVEQLLKEKSGMRPSQAKEIIKKEIDNIMSGAILDPSPSSRHDSKVAPLLDKLSDVTFTKCSTSGILGTETITTQIRKRPREQSQKQRDWPEKRHRPNDPDMMSRKIIEDSPMSSNLDNRKTSAATLTISPSKPPRPKSIPANNPVEVSKIEAVSPPYQPPSEARISPPRASNLPSVSAAVAAVNAKTHNNVDLPKVDLAFSMPSSSHHASATQESNALVLPPHPDSRSRSSEHTEDLTFAKSKVSTTPRAEQFEDRLKTIIHSVLSSDASKSGTSGRDSSPNTSKRQTDPPDANPPHSIAFPPSNANVGTSQPMFSPVKRELPAHLPPPPNTPSRNHNFPPMHQLSHSQYPSSKHHAHGNYPPNSSYGIGSYSSHQKPTTKPLPSTSHHPNSSRTINDLISCEIERSYGSTGSHPSAPNHHRRPSFNSNMPSSPKEHRDFHHIPPMTQGTRSSSSSDPTTTRMSKVIEDSIRGSGSQSQHGPSSHQAHSRLLHRGDLEGLAYPRTRSPPGHHAHRVKSASPSSSTHPSSTQVPSSNRNGTDYPAMEGLAARFGPYMDKANREGLKRSPLPSPPVLPPKKQHLDDHPDYRSAPKDDVKREWQDAISSGFDRLVAYATEVDKRRKSSDSNSPKSNMYNHPSSSSSPQCKTRDCHNPDDDSVFTPANDNKMSTLSMKFKGAARYQRHQTSPGPHSATPTGSSSSRAATPHSGGGGSRVTTPIGHPTSQSRVPAKSPLPGENLPEHHPKKRYFAETRESCSSYQRRNSHSPKNRSGLPNAMASYFPDSHEASAEEYSSPPLPTKSPPTPSSTSSFVLNRNRPTLR